MIDEARIPLVIAGGLPETSVVAYRVDSVVADLRPHAHYSLEEFARNVQLTDAGIQALKEPSVVEACLMSRIFGF